jgi:ABC-type polysaccharide/polyol phosphate export permease
MADEPKAQCYGIPSPETSGKNCRQPASIGLPRNVPNAAAGVLFRTQTRILGSRDQRTSRVCGYLSSITPDYGGILSRVESRSVGRKIDRVPQGIDLQFMEITRESSSIIYDSSRPRLAIIDEARELFRYRDLLWSLVHRDLTIRYKRSTLGFLWTMLNPLLMMLALTIVFSNLFRFQIAHYPVYLLSGTLLYGFFQWGTSQSIHSIIWGGDLMGKIYLPKTIFVAAAAFVSLVNLMLALIPLAIIMLISGCTFSFALFFVPAAIVLTFVFSLGVGLFIATLAVFFADIADIYSVALTILTYLTPIFYPISVVPKKYIALIYLNPMYYFVEIFRQPIHSGVLPDAGLIWRAILIAVGAFVIGWWFFTKRSDEFAYRV